MDHEYDDWMDDLTPKERNAVLQSERLREQPKKRGFFRGTFYYGSKIGIWLIWMVGKIILEVGNAIVWLAQKLETLLDWMDDV